VTLFVAPFTVLGRLASCIAMCLSAAAVAPAATDAVQRRESGNLVMEEIPEIPESLKERLAQYENVRAAGVVGWLPASEGLVVSTRFGETSQLHSVQAPLFYRRQLTFFNEPVAGAEVHPERPLILFLRDSGGNENLQIHLLDLRSGQTRLLSDGKSRHQAAHWDHQGRRIAFASNQRNGRDVDVYVQDLMRDDAKAELILQEGGNWVPLEFSWSGDKLLALKEISANESQLYLVDVKTKQFREITAGPKVAFGAATFARDDSRIFVTHDGTGEFQSLYEIDVASFKAKPLTAAIPWDVESVRLSGDGKNLAFLVNADGYSKLYLLDTKSRRHREVAELPFGQIHGLEFHPKKPELLALTYGSAKSSSDAYVLDLKHKKLAAWTQSEMGGLDASRLVEPSLIHFPTFDEIAGKRRLIPAFLYRDLKRTGKLPVIINIHGGPEAQFRPGFSANIQYFASDLGVAVIAPNVRGSSGYGKTYLTLDNGTLREDSVRDIGALLDWIATQPDLDSSRVMVMGGSYGGYMTLASLTHYSDRLAGGVDVVGISHFLSFLKNTKSYRQDLRRVEYGDERDPEMEAYLERISPLTNVAKIVKPLFVIQGLNDPRVPVSEAEQIVKAVRDNGHEAWYLLAKDEGHGFRKKANQSVYLQSVALFVENVLFPRRS